MQTSATGNITVVNTTKEDWDDIIWFFEQAMNLKGEKNYKVWDNIDIAGLQKDIENKLQYKILRDNDILCIFSIQYSDPFIWRDRDKNDALYLHRIVVNPDFRGQKQFQTVLAWARRFALLNNLRFIRMDTWADNARIIEYYQSFGFVFIENYRTTDAPELPVQNRDINVALLEMKINED